MTVWALMLTGRYMASTYTLGIVLLTCAISVIGCESASADDPAASESALDQGAVATGRLPQVSWGTIYKARGTCTTKWSSVEPANHDPIYFRHELVDGGETKDGWWIAFAAVDADTIVPLKVSFEEAGAGKFASEPLFANQNTFFARTPTTQPTSAVSFRWDDKMVHLEGGRGFRSGDFDTESTNPPWEIRDSQHLRGRVDIAVQGSRVEFDYQNVWTSSHSGGNSMRGSTEINVVECQLFADVSAPGIRGVPAEQLD